VLIGNTEVEDALQRLNNLTEEEARIASAELWRTTHSLGEGVQDVGRDVEDIVDEVQYVHDRIESVDEGVQAVLDTVQDVDAGLRGVGHGVQHIDHNVQSTRDEVACTNRQHFSTLLSLLLYLIYPYREPPQRQPSKLAITSESVHKSQHSVQRSSQGNNRLVHWRLYFQ
jgi:hypothetical protein